MTAPTVNGGKGSTPVKRPPKHWVPRWKLKHENRTRDRPVITPHAAKLLELLRG